MDQSARGSGSGLPRFDKPRFNASLFFRGILGLHSLTEPIRRLATTQLKPICHCDPSND